jgi:hypothetical protein
MSSRQYRTRFIVLGFALCIGLFAATATSVQAGQRFTAVLTGAQEVPANPSTGTGYGYVILSDDQTTITVNVGYFGLVSTAIDGHIHTAPVGVSGPVTFPFSASPGGTSGVYPQQTFPINAAQLAQLLAGNMYFNIHTIGSGGGEIRGQILAPSCTTASPIEVEATAGTMGPTAYASLNAATTAINAGTHQGAINVEVCGDTTETATAAILASGAGPTYTAINIYPVGAPRIITGSIVGAIIKLTGADNVTIDGRLGGIGSARQLTVSNTSNTTATAAIWLTSTGVAAGATNNVIRNLEISAGAPQNTGVLATFGINMGSNNTTISTASGGDDLDNNSFIANRIIKARTGISTRGQTTNNTTGTVITDNIIGPASFGSDEIGLNGIFLQADTGAIVSRNTVQFVGGNFANLTTFGDRCGICIGTNSVSPTVNTTITSGDYTVTRNVIHDIVDERTGSAAGIVLGTTRSGVATNNLIANNFIYNLRSNGTAGDGLVGIQITNGHTDRIVNNSISITGDMDPAPAASSTQYGLGLRINTANAANNVNFTVQNNSFYFDPSSNNATTHYYAISLNTAAYVFGTGTLNNNNYYVTGSNPQVFTGGLATATGATAATEFATLANWQAALTTPQDAASIQANPLYFSTTADIHIPTTSPNVNVGATIAGITDDIDGQARPNGANYDIGADEAYASPGTLQFSAPSYNALETAGIATITITRSGGLNGAVSVDYATVAGGTATGGATCTAGVDYINASGTETWADLDAAPQTFDITVCADGLLEPGESVNLALSNPTGAAALGTPNTAVLNIGDAGSTVGGAINVGTGELFTSLTNPGGVFEAINNNVVSANVTVNITSDLAGETGAVALNEVAGGFTVLIKPSGAPRTITGSSTVGIIRLNGADGVTIDGSTTGATGSGVGGTPSIRELTVNNTSPGATAGAVIVVMSGVAGAQNNTVKNVNIAGFSPTQTLIGIALGGAAPGAAGTDNDNNRVQNCSFQRSFIGIYNVGASAVNPNTGTVITQNDLSSTGANRLRRAGILVFNENGIQITENSIGGITSDEGLDAYGIGVGIQDVTTTAVTNGGVSNALISRNRINGIASTNTVGFSASGIAIAGDPAGPNTISNNMISGVIAPATSPDIVDGIFVAGVAGSSTRLYHNSISMTGDRGVVANQIGSYGLAISGTDPIVELKNNIFYTTQTSGSASVDDKSFAIGMNATTFVNLDSNFNDFWSAGANDAGFRTGGLGAVGSDQINLAAWQTVVLDDGSSVEVDPLFVSDVTDLHLTPPSPVLAGGTGVLLATVPADFDTDLRDNAPDIGADEIPLTGRTGTIPAGTYRDGYAGAATLSGNVDFTGTLNLTGTITTGANTLGITCTGSVVGATANNYIIGNFRRDICNTGIFDFPVGTVINGAARGSGDNEDNRETPEGTIGEFSPATVTVNSGVFPSSLTMSVVDTWMAGMGQTSSLSRFWVVTETGDLNVDMTMQYLPEDVYGLETAYTVFRNQSVITTQQPGSVNAAANQFTATGVTAFSNWTAGNANVPTAAGVDLSGRVTTADGRGIVNAVMTIQGGGLTQPRLARTGPFGYYAFTDLAAGQTYIVTIHSKRFTFTVPSRAVVLVDSIGDFDFVAEPQE